jgi:hypothetical protein
MDREWEEEDDKGQQRRNRSVTGCSRPFLLATSPYPPALPSGPTRLSVKVMMPAPIGTGGVLGTERAAVLA